MWASGIRLRPSPIVIPALRLPARQALRINFSLGLKAGIHRLSGCGRSLMVRRIWIPACAGMTV